MRKPLIAGNWKMHKTINEAIDLATGIKRQLLDFDKVDIVLCPPFTSLNSVYEVILDTSIKLGAQDMFWENEGAYTGEVSGPMLKDCGCEFVIIGHSERRKYFGETDETVNKKVKAALECGLTPIVCVGETLDEREAGKMESVVETQLKGAFGDISEKDMEKVIIAYEPVWAIGTGKTATPQEAEDMHRFIRTWLKEKFSQDVAAGIIILYGGSVKPANIADLMAGENIDGALVGGASLKVDSFVEIVKNAV